MAIFRYNVAAVAFIETTLMLRFGKFLLGLLVLPLLLAAPQPASAKDYIFPSIEIEVLVNRDGTFDVIEQRSYQFDGSFSWGTYELPLRSGYESIADFRISEGERPFELTERATEEPYTYTIEVRDDKFVATFYYRAEDQTRTYTFAYRVIGGITKYQDVAELNWRFIGTGWDKPARNVSVTVNLPDSAPEGELLAWGHGPLSGNVTILDSQTVLLDTPTLGASEMLEGRIVFPADFILGAAVPEEALQRIRDDEAELQRKTDEEIAINERNKQLLLYYLLGFIPAVIVGWLLFYWRVWRQFGKDHAVGPLPKYLHEPPSKRIPATVPVLLGQGAKPSTNAFTATIFDLARRRFLKIEDERQVKSGLFGAKIKYKSFLILRNPDYKNDTTLRPVEREIIEWIFDKAAKGAERIAFDDLTEYFKSNASSFRSFFSKWQGEIVDLTKQEKFLEAASNKWVNRFWVVTGLISLIVPPLILFGMFLIPHLRRRTPVAAREAKLWERFKQFLKDFSNFDKLPPESLILWEEYLVYGIALGETRSILKALPLILQETTRQPDWYTIAGESHFNTAMLSSFDSTINNLFDSLKDSTNRAASYSDGSGGGFSSGSHSSGGGGGSGGSAG